MTPVLIKRLFLSTLVLLVACCAQTSGTVRGVVIEVDGTLNEISSFTLLVEGEEIGFVPDDDGDYAFPLSHLREHRTNGEPVVVEWDMVDGERHALSVTDG